MAQDVEACCFSGGAGGCSAAARAPPATGRAGAEAASGRGAARRRWQRCGRVRSRADWPRVALAGRAGRRCTRGVASTFWPDTLSTTRLAHTLSLSVARALAVVLSKQNADGTIDRKLYNPVNLQHNMRVATNM